MYLKRTGRPPPPNRIRAILRFANYDRSMSVSPSARSALARRMAGFQLRRVQQGLDPEADATVGPGVREIRIHIAAAHLPNGGRMVSRETKHQVSNLSSHRWSPGGMRVDHRLATNRRCQRSSVAGVIR